MYLAERRSGNSVGSFQSECGIGGAVRTVGPDRVLAGASSQKIPILTSYMFPAFPLITQRIVLVLSVQSQELVELDAGNAAMRYGEAGDKRSVALVLDLVVLVHRR